MRAIADELSFIGSPVSDDDLVIQILAGLGSDFNSVVAAANAKDHLGFAELQAMLLGHESLLLSQIGGGASVSLPSDSVPAALYTQPRPNSNSNSRGNRSGRGHRYRGGSNDASYTRQQPILPTPARPTFSGPNLSGPNYSARPQSQIPVARANNPDKDSVCQVCSRRGHSARICWYRTYFANYSDQPGPIMQAHLTQSGFQANNAQTTSFPTGPE